MSRSYKHMPRCGDRKSRYSKRYANRIVRRANMKESFPPYGGYKKLFESWNICDYEIKAKTFEGYCADLIRWCFLAEKPLPDWTHSKNQYAKLFLRK